MTTKRIRDEKGNIYPSINEAARVLGLALPGGKTYQLLNKNGMVTYGGYKFYFAGMNGSTAPTPAKVAEDPLMVKLRERYSQKELEMIAAGEGIEKRFIPFPEIRLSGKHHKMLVISDTHVGSVYFPKEFCQVAADFANNPENGIDCVLHCGDLVDGLKISRTGTQIYELTEIGFDAQRKAAIEVMSRFNKPIYIISGNHDMYFKEYAGANIVQSVCDAVPNMTYIGHDTADIDVDGCKIRLFHGGDGSSYALSYRLQKLVEAIAGGKKPNILLAGHVHKFCYIMERNIHAISVPSMQTQTAFMRARKLASHTGFLVLDFDTNEGKVANLAVKYYPFYV